jgi:tRNA A37 threonylcarbamoyladenosine modification protein TsaB
MYGDNVKEIIKLLESKLNEAYLDSIKDVAKLIDEKLDESYMRGFEDGQKQKEYDLIQDEKLEEEYKKGYERGFVDGQKKKEVDFIQDLNLSGKYLIGFSKGYEKGVKDERKRIYGLIDAFADSQNKKSMKLSNTPAYVKVERKGVIPDNKVTLGEATEEFIKMQLEQREEEEDPRMILCQH